MGGLSMKEGGFVNARVALVSRGTVQSISLKIFGFFNSMTFSLILLLFLSSARGDHISSKPY